jgi:hypothetical protein
MGFDSLRSSDRQIMKYGMKLNRRTILRGLLGSAAVAVALPPLEAMLNAHGTALANGAALPRPFGVWFFGDGVRLERWVPSATGADWPVSDELRPLETAGVKPYVSVVSGMESKGHSYVHAGPASAVLTGTGLLHPDGDSGTPEGPSIDVIVADQIGATTPFKTLETGLYTFLGNGSAYTAISHTGPDAPNNPENDARKVYERLFGAGSPGANVGGGPTIVDYTLQHRKSALDAVLDECAALNSVLGQADRARLEQHCESVRAIERRLASGPSTVLECTRPEPPSNITDDKASFALYGTSEHFKEVNQTMSALIAHALACDLTRVFTHCYTNPASHYQIIVDGVSASFHVMTHDEAGEQPVVHQGVVRTMEHLADTLTIFRDMPYGTGNLLDAMALLVTSDCSVGKTHDYRDYPMLVVGKAGGALRPDVHYRSPSAESITSVPLTMARAVGANLDSFGTDAQHVVSSVSQLLA